MADKQLESGSAAFLLIDDLYNDIRRNGLRKDDTRRLTAIVSDKRIKKLNFQSSKLDVDNPATQELRDALLHRAISDPEVRRAVSLVIVNLPDGAFREASPLLDRALEVPAIARTGMTVKLAEQGPKAASRLTDFVESGFATPRRVNGHAIGDWGRDAMGAIAGLCKLGMRARNQLPRLKAIEARGFVPKIRHPRWQTLLVALGDDPNRFNMPDNMNNSLDRYRQKLVRDAKNGCAR